ncbi:hypothetical protein, partial [Xylanibacter caecicola]|uniref:hypothetical protein n=1 Tax=Xylanibacter caecicola TaxID=2736294 RepID=UPI00259D2A5A
KAVFFERKKEAKKREFLLVSFSKCCSFRFRDYTDAPICPTDMQKTLKNCRFLREMSHFTLQNMAFYTRNCHTLQ